MKSWQRFARWRWRLWAQRLEACRELAVANEEFDFLYKQITGRPFPSDQFCKQYERKRFDRAQRHHDFWLRRVPIKGAATQ